MSDDEIIWEKLQKNMTKVALLITCTLSSVRYVTVSATKSSTHVHYLMFPFTSKRYISANAPSAHTNTLGTACCLIACTLCENTRFVFVWAGE